MNPRDSRSFQIAFTTPISFPKPVYRFVREEKHAEALLSGKVWISTLSECRKYEEIGRGDSGEGTIEYRSGHIKGDGGDKEFENIAIKFGIEISPESKGTTISGCVARKILIDAFVLCTTVDFSQSKLSPTFGSFCIKIADSEEFFRRVSLRLIEQIPIKEFACGPIIYRARDIMAYELEPGPLGFVKPPDQYQEQKEFRMLWVPTEFDRVEPFLLDVPEIADLCHRMA